MNKIIVKVGDKSGHKKDNLKSKPSISQVIEQSKKPPYIFLLRSDMSQPNPACRNAFSYHIPSKIFISFKAVLAVTKSDCTNDFSSPLES